MKHLFVTYELALALKEKGFDEDCIGWYLSKTGDYGHDKGSLVLRYIEGTTYSKGHPSIIIAPLYQQVVDWFREKHKILVFADTTMDFTTHTPTVQKLGEGHIRVSGQIEFDDYYEALEAAIKHAINLIP